MDFKGWKAGTLLAILVDAERCSIFKASAFRSTRNLLTGVAWSVEGGG